MFSLQQILGHATVDMVRRYVFLASFETVRRLHAAASPPDGLVIGPKISLFIPRAWVGVLDGLADASRVTVQQLIRSAIARFLALVAEKKELAIIVARGTFQDRAAETADCLDFKAWCATVASAPMRSGWAFSDSIR